MVSTGTIGRSIQLPLRVEWQTSKLPSPVTGIVTGLGDRNRTLAEGDLLIEVELGPVFAIEGETPLIRELSSGSVGKDVLTLQRFLEREGHLLIDPDGKFGPGTVRGVKEWQQSVGLKRSGSIEVGQFVVLPDLPSDIRLIESVGVGKHVVLGEDFLEIIDPTPRYSSLYWTDKEP